MVPWTRRKRKSGEKIAKTERAAQDSVCGLRTPSTEHRTPGRNASTLYCGADKQDEKGQEGVGTCIKLRLKRERGGDSNGWRHQAGRNEMRRVSVPKWLVFWYFEAD